MLTRGCLAALLLMMPAVTEGTAVIVFRSPTRVVLASDSQLFERDEKACKIRPAGKWWALTAGIMTTKRPSLDVQALTATALVTVRAFTEVEGALREHVYQPLHGVLTRASAGPAMRQLFEAGDTVTSIAVAGIDGGVPTVGVLYVRATTLDPVKLSATWHTCPGDWCEPDGQSVYYAASVDGPAVNRVRERPLQAWVAKGDAAAARRLIHQQIEATPAEVGGPVDVLEITSAGARWINRDPGSRCAVER